MTDKRSFAIAPQQAAYIADKIASGEYGSEDEVLAAAISALQERDLELERWIADKVLPAYDEWKAHPERVKSADEVFDRLEARIRDRSARKAS